MTNLTGLPCPAHRNASGGSDSYTFDDEKGVGGCFSCGLRTFIGGKGDLMGKYEDSGDVFIIEANGEAPEPQYTYDHFEVDDNNNKYAYKAHRGIQAEVMKFFDVRHGTYKKWQVKKGDVVVDSGVSRDFFRFPYPSGPAKVRHEDLPKDHKGHFGNMDGLIKTSELFGMNLFPKGVSKFITITEGEYDALSAYQMLKKGSYINPCVSLAGANPDTKTMFDKSKHDSTYHYLDSFEKIILCVDQDEAGDMIANKFRLAFPKKVYRVNMGKYKDPNQMLQDGAQAEFVNAWWAAVGGPVYSPQGTYVSVDDYLKLYEDTPEFVSFLTDIPELDRLIYGISKGYLTLIIAPTGIGKSEFMRFLEWKCLKNSDFKFASCRKEEPQGRSLLGLVSYAIGKDVTTKNKISEELDQEVRYGITEVAGTGQFITFSIDEEWEVGQIIDHMRYFIAAHDIDFFFLEPIQDLITATDSSKKEGKISLLTSRLEGLIKETGVGVVVIAHQNQNEGAMYSSMVEKKAGFKIVLRADREHEDSKERNRTYLFVEKKNRSGNGFGPAGVLTFDKESYTLQVVGKETDTQQDQIPF